MTDLVEAARAVLRDNDRGGYTVPTSGLYPYQWNWDAAFCALGWITFDEPRAWRELTRLMEGQWADGMVPHIVFHAPSDTYFPGPDVWRTPHVPATSGITQPAVLASAARLCLERARNKALAEDNLATLYPRMLAWHRWWVGARDPERSGLVGMLHPWESGMDNSPAWDAALARVSPTPTSAIRRRDLGHVDAAMRPSEDFYKRVIALVDLYASLDWQPSRMWAQTPVQGRRYRIECDPASRQPRPARARAALRDAGRAGGNRRAARRHRGGDRSPVERRRGHLSIAGPDRRRAHRRANQRRPAAALGRRCG